MLVKPKKKKMTASEEMTWYHYIQYEMFHSNPCYFPNPFGDKVKKIGEEEKWQIL